MAPVILNKFVTHWY